MKPRRRFAPGLAALTAGAMLLALAGCGKNKTGEAGDDPDKPAKSMAGLLDFNARETSRIIAASADRPALLDRMLVAIGQPDPYMLWAAKLRTTTPFKCRTQTATMVRCFAALSRVGADGVVGYANVMMYDHDITIDELRAERDRVDPPGTAQTVQSTTTQLYNSASDGSYTGPYATCRQAVGMTGNGPATCFTLIGPRTALWARLDADPPNISADGTLNISLRPAMVVAGIDWTIRQLRTLEVAPDGSFSVYRLPANGPKMAYAGAGWYARDRELFVKDSLFAGPYDDEASCQSDLSRANLAYQQFRREQDAAIEGCAYYASAPVGL